MTDEYELLSSTRYDEQLLNVDWNTSVNNGTPSPFLLLPYHVDRLRDAAHQHGWSDAPLSLASLSKVCEEAITRLAGKGPFRKQLPLKVRILLKRDGSLSATATPCVPFPFPDLLAPSSDAEHIRTIVVDTQPTPPSIFTSTKTTRRDIYDVARARLDLPPFTTPAGSRCDVLIWNTKGELMETSIRNIAFRRNDRWMTPPIQSGCLPGVMRRVLIERGMWVEAADGELMKDDIVDGEVVMTANSVEAGRLGRIQLKPGQM
ncbi:D-aminoacid aminotransferase-like PLP-dependent enzyme [Panus rudis PR-1116 ss-1]|nr:D-aminoacid aminotransferase-like PLP-dependent enzyme [Panus rudis PR-1116 ss-1]